MTLNEILYYIDLCNQFLKKEKVWDKQEKEPSFEEFWPPLYKAKSILDKCRNKVGDDWDTIQFRANIKSIADNIWGIIHNRGDIIDPHRYIVPNSELLPFLRKFGVKGKRVYVWEFANLSAKVSKEI